MHTRIRVQPTTAQSCWTINNCIVLQSAPSPLLAKFLTGSRLCFERGNGYSTDSDVALSEPAGLSTINKSILLQSSLALLSLSVVFDSIHRARLHPALDAHSPWSSSAQHAAEHENTPRLFQLLKLENRTLRCFSYSPPAVSATRHHSMMIKGVPSRQRDFCLGVGVGSAPKSLPSPPPSRSLTNVFFRLESVVHSPVRVLEYDLSPEIDPDSNARHPSEVVHVLARGRCNWQSAHRKSIQIVVELLLEVSIPGNAPSLWQSTGSRNPIPLLPASGTLTTGQWISLQASEDHG